MRVELDTLGTDCEVGELFVAPEFDERGVVPHAATQREEDEDAAVRGRASSAACLSYPPGYALPNACRA